MDSDFPIIGVVSVIVSAVLGLATAGVSVLAMRRTDSREHHRWLQEKRREAYVEFLSATRSAYESIADRGQGLDPDRMDDLPADSGAATEAREEIDQKMSHVKHAREVMAIVGPESVAQQGRQIIARLRIDRVYYSPTRATQLQDRDKVLRDVAETGNEDFRAAMEQAYAGGDLDLHAYKETLRLHRLESFWNSFIEESRRIMSADQLSD